MIFKIIPEKNKFIEKVYNKSMKELNKFYEKEWKEGIPKLIIVNDRKTIDKLNGHKTEEWVVGWSEGRNIFILNPKNYEKESNHKYSNEEYSRLIKHELSHSFLNLSSQHPKYKLPSWFSEGIAIFTSGQNKFKKIPKKFEKFLEFHDKGGREVYRESGFVIELLIKKFGKGKLLKLVKELRNIKDKKAFEKLFKEVYGFSLNYKNINRLYKK